MFLQIEGILSSAEVRAVAELARQARFVDGRRSNPHNTTKINVIGDADDPVVQNAAQLALAALQRNEQVNNFVFPQRIVPPSLCRYGAGMTYGAHTDVAFLPLAPRPLRSDVSCTIFIAEPDAYQGGELVIYLGSESMRVKGRAGSAVFYPSTTVHEVVPVTAGERLVMISFIQSLVPDQMHRDLLYTLGEVSALEGLKMEWRNRILLENVRTNLLRMWSR